MFPILPTIENAPEEQYAYLLRDFDAARIQRICGITPLRQLKDSVLANGGIPGVEDFISKWLARLKSIRLLTAPSNVTTS